MNRKILHAADIHLDSPLQKLGDYEGAPVEEIRGASRRALENLVELAIEETVDLVLIAGDLYDGDWPDQNTGLFFVAQASKLIAAGIPVVVIRGNHDAANRMTSSLPLPSNPDGSEIMMRANQVDIRQFESIGVAVHGRSFQRRAETDNLAAAYPHPISGMFNVGLLHTSLTGAEGHDPYAPCTPAQLADKHYDYWALGHIHVRGNHAVDGGAPVMFSGNLQGRHIRESGPKGCVLVDIDPSDRCETRFCELDVVRWQLCQIDVSNLRHSEEVVDEFQNWLLQALQEADQRLLVVRVELVGRSDFSHGFRKNQRQLKADLQATTVTYGYQRVWLEELKVRCTQPVDRGQRAELDGPLESLQTVIAQLQTGDDLGGLVQAELKSLAQKLPLELGGVEPALSMEDPAWVGDLLESAASEVLGRLERAEDGK